MKELIPKELEKFSFFSKIDELENIVVCGVREAMKNIMEKHASESFYIFGIDIPNDLGALYFGGNSEENFQNIIAEKKCSKGMEQYYRWCWHEWGKYEVLEPQPVMKQTWTWVHEHSEWLNIEDERTRDQYYECQEQLMLAIARRALKINDDLGTFGIGPDRDKIVLYASIYGFNDDVFWQSIKELNPKSAIPKAISEMYNSDGS